MKKAPWRLSAPLVALGGLAWLAWLGGAAACSPDAGSRRARSSAAARDALAAKGGTEGRPAEEGARPAPRDVPVVRLLDGAASETLRRTYANVAGENPTSEELQRENAWIDSVATPLRAFWTAHGERIIADLAAYTGTAWVEASFNIYFIRRHVGPVAFSLPLVLDLSPFERVPPDQAGFYYGLLEWALVHELVHRVRDQPSIARSQGGREETHPAVRRIAGSAHDWDDVVAAFVLRDVLGEAAIRPLLFNRALQRTIGVYRLDRLQRDVLARWRPSASRPLAAWLAESAGLDTGFHDTAAEQRLEEAFAGAGYVPADRVRATARELADDFGLAPEQVAQLLSDWEGVHGEGRLLTFPYRAPDGRWEWQESR